MTQDSLFGAPAEDGRCPNDPGCAHALSWHKNGRCGYPNRVHTVCLCGKLPVEPYPNGQVPHVAGSDTSEAAAESVKPNRATKQATVLSLIKAQGDGGLTDLELESVTGWQGSTVRPRRRELELAGLIKDSGERRKTATGRMATVWIAT